MPTFYTIEEIEDKIVAALQAQAGHYVRTCKSHQGELSNEEAFVKQLALLPAMLVVFVKRTPGQLSPYGHVQKYEHQFDIMLIASDMRGEHMAREKPGGVYQMIQDCDDALLDQKLGMDLPTPIRPGGTELQFTTPTLSAFTTTYFVDVYRV